MTRDRESLAPRGRFVDYSRDEFAERFRRIALPQGARYPPKMPSTLARVLMAAGLAVAIAGAFVAGRFHAVDPSGPVDPPAVVAAIRDVARLETTTFHIEKVIEVTDAQSRLWGLVEAKDAVLLVAVGDVVAGIDLARLRDDAVTVDGATHTAHVHMPAAEVLSSTLDERATHVYSRSTDTLADRNEQLEGEARRRAEDAMRKAAIDAGILDRAQSSAERTLRTLLRSLGYEHVELDWAERG
jgi:hypothetical protein